MDDWKKRRPGPPFIGPNGPEPPPQCGMPPDFPEFCPPPVRPPAPCMPPVPTVVQGDSLLQAMNNLSGRVNTCISTYNDVIANCYQTLRNLELAAEENGSYYGPCEVWVEDGYYAASGSVYKLVHKAVVDRRGNPIRVQLHLAYGNATNSRITQSPFSASQTMFADKLFNAVPLNQETGWTGNAMWQGAPIPHGDAPGGYTMGFNRAGVLRVYLNSVTTEQMARDEIVDAMGCMGPLVQNGQVVEDSLLEKIPNYDMNASRVAVGQNMNSREIIFLVCGAENNVDKNGLTSKACAEILQGYGCDLAVEITNSAAACAIDKGGLMFEPTGGTIPDSYAFWYITRACYYKGDYERELAQLTQNYHELAWKTMLNEDGFERLQEQITQEVDRATAAEQELDEAIKTETERAKAAEEALAGSSGAVSTKLTAEIERAKAAEAELQSNINAESNRAKTAEQLLQDSLTTETADRKAADEALSNRITAEELARQNADHTLQQAILTESNDRAEADQRLENLISAETTRAQAEEKKLADSIAAETARAEIAERTLTTNLNAEITRAQSVEDTLSKAIQDETAARTAAIEQINSTIETINNQVSSINQTITTINASITRLNTLYDNLTQQVTTMDAALVSMQTTVNQIETTVNELKQTVAEMQQLVDDAVKKLIQDIEAGTVVLPYVKKSGDTMTGPLNITNNAFTTTLLGNILRTRNNSDNSLIQLQIPGGISSLPEPENNADAATKQYVDNKSNKIIQNKTFTFSSQPFSKYLGYNREGTSYYYYFLYVINSSLYGLNDPDIKSSSYFVIKNYSTEENKGFIQNPTLTRISQQSGFLWMKTGMIIRQSVGETEPPSNPPAPNLYSVTFDIINFL